MFYSQCLLSKKGPLGTVWLAAHCHKRLKKDQVYQTNISSSVDKILLDEVPIVTYRILAYLLLGIVRIYSNKVEYLFRDCRRVLNELHEFASTKKSDADIEVICAPYSSIIVPARFELDAFDLEVVENSSRDCVKAHEKITLKGKSDGIWSQSFDQSYLKEDTFHCEGYSAGHTPLKYIYSPNTMTTEVLASTSHNLRDMEGSMEKFCSTKFSLEDYLPPMIFDEAEDVADYGKTFPEKYQADGVEINPPDSSMMREDDAGPKGDIKSSIEEHADQEQTKFSGMSVLQNEKIPIISRKGPVSISIHATPESKVPAAGARTPEFMGVRTPATKEGATFSKKRKCLCDDIIAIPNKVYKAGLDDPSDLVKKRRKNVFCNKAKQMATKMFFEPLITCVSINFESLLYEKEQKAPDPFETTNTSGIVDKLGSSTVDGSRGEEAIAPSTPVTNSVSQRYNNTFGVSCSERQRRAVSYKIVERERSPRQDRESDMSLTDEEDIKSCDGDDKQEKYNWSTRTRAVARFLHNKYLTKMKRGADEFVTLSQVMERKSKKTSARMFYELLVLVTGGFVNVKQDKPYDDISVLETGKLKQVYEADEQRRKMRLEADTLN